MTSSSVPSSTYTGPTPALITAFTASASCTVDISQVGISGDCYNDGESAPCQFFHLGPFSTLTDCYPASFTPDPAFYYSPGFCPANYVTACSAVSKDKRDDGTTLAETVITCCPSGYSCHTGASSDLLSWETFDHCTSQMTMSQQLIYTTTVVGKGEVTYTETRQEGINAYGVVVRHQATDTPPVTSSVPASSMTTASPGSGGGSGNSTTGGAGGGMSAGAKAGVGIGAAIGAIAVIALVAALVLLRRRRQLAAGDDAQQSMMAHDSLGPNGGGGGGGGPGVGGGMGGGYAAGGALAAGGAGAYAAYAARAGGGGGGYAPSSYGGSIYEAPASAYSDQPTERFSPAPAYPGAVGVVGGGGAYHATAELQATDPAQDHKASELQAITPSRLVEAP